MSASTSKPDERTDVWGFLHEVSPVKTPTAGKQPYFSGIIQTAQTEYQHFSCHDITKHRKLATVCEEEKMVELKQVFKGGNSFRCVRSSKINTEIPSAKRLRFDFQPPNQDITTIKQIKAQQNHDNIYTVLAKVLEVGPVSRGSYSGQNVTLLDDTDAIMIRLWNNRIGKLEQGKAYLIKNVQSKSFDDEITLKCTITTEFLQSEVNVATTTVATVVKDGEIITCQVIKLVMCSICNSAIDIADTDKSYQCTTCHKRMARKLLTTTVQIKLSLDDTGIAKEYAVGVKALPLDLQELPPDALESSLLGCFTITLLKDQIVKIESISIETMKKDHSAATRKEKKNVSAAKASEILDLQSYTKP